MNFWERVEDLLDQKDITKKELALNLGFSPSNMSKGKKENSFPSAETAVAIAKYLNTTVEYLVTGTTALSCNDRQKDLSDLYRYTRTVKKLDAIPEGKRKVFEIMIQDVGNDSTD